MGLCWSRVKRDAPGRTPALPGASSPASDAPTSAVSAPGRIASSRDQQKTSDHLPPGSSARLRPLPRPHRGPLPAVRPTLDLPTAAHRQVPARTRSQEPPCTVRHRPEVRADGGQPTDGAALLPPGFVSVQYGPQLQRCSICPRSDARELHSQAHRPPVSPAREPQPGHVREPRLRLAPRDECVDSPAPAQLRGKAVCRQSPLDCLEYCQPLGKLLNSLTHGNPGTDEWTAPTK